MIEHPTHMDAFLAEPHMARVAVIRKSGQPHMKPIWYLYEGGKFILSTGRDSVTVRCLRRDPRITLCVDDPVAPYRAVVVEGTAEVLEGVGLDHELLGRLARRYLGQEAARGFLQGPLAQKQRVRVVVTPQRWTTWDYRTGT